MQITFADYPTYSIDPTYMIAVGGFVMSQLIEGKIAMFYMWDHELSRDQKNFIDFNTTGNLLTMADMSIEGPAIYSYENILSIIGLYDMCNSRVISIGMN